jgi:hypothetical protein
MSLTGDAAELRDIQPPPLDFGGFRRLRRPGFDIAGDGVTQQCGVVKGKRCLPYYNTV